MPAAITAPAGPGGPAASAAPAGPQPTQLPHIDVTPTPGAAPGPPAGPPPAAPVTSALPRPAAAQAAPATTIAATATPTPPAALNPLGAVTGLMAALLGVVGASGASAARYALKPVRFGAKTTALTGPPSPTKVEGSAGLTINLIWDTRAAHAPASFRSAVVAAATEIGAHVSDKITVNITVGYGEIGGPPIPRGTAEGQPLNDRQESYPTVKKQLTDAATSPTDAAVLASLPAVSPFGTLTYDVSSAQLKVFGLLPANNTATDGEVGFSTDWTGAALVAAALHELTHAMGRNSGWGSRANGYDITPLDLTRYSSAGVRTANGSPLATRGGLQYFSLDGGRTPLAYYDNTSDYGDWATTGSTTTDPLDAVVPTKVSTALSRTDLQVLDSIGFTVT